MPELSPKRILIVSQQLELRRSMIELFDAMGFAVEAVKEGQNAISVHQQFGTHVIIIDTTSPNGHALTLLRNLRDADRTVTIAALYRGRATHSNLYVGAGATFALRAEDDLELLASKVILSTVSPQCTASSTYDSVL